MPVQIYLDDKDLYYFFFGNKGLYHCLDDPNSSSLYEIFKLRNTQIMEISNPSDNWFSSIFTMAHINRVKFISILK